MFRLFRKDSGLLVREVAGISFRNPLGVFYSEAGRHFASAKRTNAAFITLSPPSGGILKWIGQLQDYRSKCVLAVNLSADIQRSFSLVYDFADLIVLAPDSDNGIDATDIADTQHLIDEVVSLRLCYERYTPIFLRLSHGLTEEELRSLLSSCQMSGVDGAFVPGKRMLSLAKEITLGRFPLVGVAVTQEEALGMIQEGYPLVETKLKPVAACKLLKTIENQAQNKK